VQFSLLSELSWDYHYPANDLRRIRILVNFLPYAKGGRGRRADVPACSTKSAFRCQKRTPSTSTELDPRSQRPEIIFGQRHGDTFGARWPRPSIALGAADKALP